MKNKKIKIEIPFNKPYITGKEIEYIMHAHSLGKLSGDGLYTQKCAALIEKMTKAKRTLLTHSCTGALEMMVILANILPGDEVIMPSYTFTSTANAVVLRGGIPVFIDIRPDTLNIDERLIEGAITKKTKAIFVVHYAGIGCEMDAIKRIAKKHKLLVLEDAAQGFLSSYKGKQLGTIGDLGAYSFHETKNVISGEGGSLLINSKKFIERAQIIREKGTNRNKFFRGLVKKYTWVDMGSSYLPSEIIAAFLYAQLENMHELTKKRLGLWHRYHDAFSQLEKNSFLRRPIIPKECKYNAHMYYILLNDLRTRGKLIEVLKKKGILSVFHYIPLHSSPAGKKFSRYNGKMSVTNKVSDTILRLPLFYSLLDSDQQLVIKTVVNFFKYS